MSSQKGRYEVIVVDGGSSDSTREVVRRTAGVRLVEAQKGRAVQMNAGADAAVGDCRAGAFRHRFDSRDVGEVARTFAEIEALLNHEPPQRAASSYAIPLVGSCSVRHRSSSLYS